MPWTQFTAYGVYFYTIVYYVAGDVVLGHKHIKNPIKYSVDSTIIITALFMLSHIFVQNNIFGVLIDSALRAAFTVPVIIRLGYIVNGNGFRFAFSAKGFFRGIIAGAALLFYALLAILQFFNMTRMNTSFIIAIPAVILQQITTGLFEESLFRGLFMTALIYKWGSSVKGRIWVVFISGFLFGAFHLLNIVIGGELASVASQAFFAWLIGMGLSAIYLFSGNLLSCMFVHALWDIAIHLSNALIAEWRTGVLFQIIQILQAILLYVLIPLFAIFISVKSKPFNNEYSTN